MGVSLVGSDGTYYTVYDPRPVYEYCAKKGLPLDWYGKANRFMTSLGEQPGRAWVIMAYQDLDTINNLTSGVGIGGTPTVGINDLYQLSFDYPGDSNANTQAGNIQIRDLLIIRADGLTVGNQTDPLGMYIVELADCRWIASNPFFQIPANAQYNVRAPSAAQDYYDETLNGGSGGSPFGWQDVVNDLWTQIDLPNSFGSTAPTIPSAALPALNPEGLKFIGVPAWSALNDVLMRIGCALALDPTKSVAQGDMPWSIAQVGANPTTDPSVNSIITNQPNIIFDTNPFESYRARVVPMVNVAFHRYYKHYGMEATTGTDTLQWSTSPIYAITVTDPTSTPGTEPTATTVIYDDLPAIIDHDFATVINLTDLTNRANERAADYYRLVKMNRLHKIYMGVISDPGFFPGQQIIGFAIGDSGSGYQTEIITLQPPLWPDENGKWASDPGRMIERLRPPDLGRATFPLYPQVDQFAQINNPVPDSEGKLDCNLVIEDPETLSTVTREPVWVISANGAGS